MPGDTRATCRFVRAIQVDVDGRRGETHVRPASASNVWSGSFTTKFVQFVKGVDHPPSHCQLFSPPLIINSLPVSRQILAGIPNRIEQAGVKIETFAHRQLAIPFRLTTTGFRFVKGPIVPGCIEHNTIIASPARTKQPIVRRRFQRACHKSRCKHWPPRWAVPGVACSPPFAAAAHHPSAAI
jgi:hypothetical protein